MPLDNFKQCSVRSEFGKTGHSKELTPPFVPSFDNYYLDDVQYFDREFTKRASRDSPVNAASANLGINLCLNPAIIHRLKC